MTRLEEVEELIDGNLRLIKKYSQRAAELSESVKRLIEEREQLIEEAEN